MSKVGLGGLGVGGIMGSLVGSVCFYPLQLEPPFPVSIPFRSILWWDPPGHHQLWGRRSLTKIIMIIYFFIVLSIIISNFIYLLGNVFLTRVGNN